MSNKLYTVYSYVFIHTGMVAPRIGKGKGFYKSPTGGRRWRPGTQALCEIRHEMHSTQLCSPPLPFLWYVHQLCKLYNCKFVCNVKHVEHLINTSVFADLSGI